MFPYYRLLNLDLASADFNRIKGSYRESFGEGYHNYEIQDIDYLNGLIKDQIQFLIPPEYINWTEISHSGLNPHTDNCSVALNYCVASPESTTVFWKEKFSSEPKLIPTTHGQDLSRTYEYSFDDLEIATVVTFKPHTAFLLNTHQIHNLNKNSTEPRCHIRWMWRDIPYRIVEKSIRELL